LNKTDELIRSITDGLGDVFYGIYIIDLVKNEYVINSSREVTRKAMEGEKDAKAALRKGVSLVVAPEYREQSYEFNDFSTLPERLKNRQSITLDFVDVYGNKCSGSFLASDRDENGIVTKVLYVFRYTDSKENDAQINKDLEAKNSSRDCVIKSDVQLSARIQEIEALYDSLGFAEWRFEIGKNGKITDVIFDSKIYKMLGFDDTNTKLINGGIELISFVHPDDLELSRKYYLETMRRRRKLFSIENRFRTKDGSYKWFRVIGCPIKEENGVRALYGAAIDIEEEKKNEIENSRYTAIVEALSSEYSDVFWLDLETDRSIALKAKGVVIKDYMNHVRSYSKVMDDYISRFVHEDDKTSALWNLSAENILDKIRSRGEFVYTYRVIYEGKIKHYQAFYKFVEGTNLYNSFIITGLKDIGDIVALEEKHRKDIDKLKKDIDDSKKTVSALEIDQLTGVYTRQAFLHKAGLLLKYDLDTEYDIIVSDIQDFKQINEKYGTKIGDEILKSIGRGFDELDDTKCIIGRYGADQFALLIEHQVIVDNDFYKNFDMKKRLDASLPEFVNNIGIYPNVDHKIPVITLCDLAHLAIDKIRNRYDECIAIYDDELKKEIEVKRTIENNMHKALVNNEFRVFYQPKHSAVTGELIGAEALIRWIHPKYGFMSPGDFIPIFEETGFVTEADIFVWNRTCQNLKKWTDSGLKVVPVSVNASKLDFLKKDFEERLNKGVRDNQVSPELLHIEVTESQMAHDSDRLINSLSYLRYHGFKIELDDFGAGFSSLNVLSTLPIDVVKLDMAFMSEMEDLKKNMVLQACVDLSRNLGFETISEGVETKEQLEKLKIIGVDAIQGYYYSRPLSEEDFEAYLVEKLNA